jgi:hypothetical protein
MILAARSANFGPNKASAASVFSWAACAGRRSTSAGKAAARKFIPAGGLATDGSRPKCSLDLSPGADENAPGAQTRPSGSGWPWGNCAARARGLGPPRASLPVFGPRTERIETPPVEKNVNEVVNLCRFGTRGVCNLLILLRLHIVNSKVLGQSCVCWRTGASRVPRTSFTFLIDFCGVSLKSAPIHADSTRLVGFLGRIATK